MANEIAAKAEDMPWRAAMSELGMRLVDGQGARRVVDALAGRTDLDEEADMTDGSMDGLAGQRVLVTGGAGVIARELLDRLSTAGASVLSVDRLPLPTDPPPGVEHLVADLAFADLEPIARFRPRHVFHLAATFERSVESPEFWDQNWNDNVVVTHRLAELAARIGDVESFVFASSYLVYDPEQYSTTTPPTAAVPLAESSRLGSRNLCGAAKLYGEAELHFVREVQAAGFRASFARIFRVYGRGSRDVVSRWVRAALDGEPIAVYHAENRFDYIFSGDVAEGLMRMAVSPGAAGIINLGSGNARPVADVIDADRAGDAAAGSTPATTPSTSRSRQAVPTSAGCATRSTGRRRRRSRPASSGSSISSVAAVAREHPLPPIDEVRPATPTVTVAAKPTDRTRTRSSSTRSGASGASSRCRRAPSSTRSTRATTATCSTMAAGRRTSPGWSAVDRTRRSNANGRPPRSMPTCWRRST